MALKIKLDQILKNLDGKSIKEGSEKGKELTLRLIVCNALGGGYPDELKTLTTSEVIMRYSLSVNIYKAKAEIELTSDEIELIKKLIVKSYPAAIISGQAIAMIDPPPKDRETRE